MLGQITLLFPELEVDLQKQLQLKCKIEEVLDNYNVTLKTKSITKCDIEEKVILFLACKKQEGYSKNTLDWHLIVLERLYMYFNKPLLSISTMDLRRFLYEYSNGKDASTINSYITRLRVFFNWLQEEGYIITNPAVQLKKSKSKKKLKQPYSAITIEKLRNACTTTRDKALYEVLESTACRISELVNIKKEDINFEEQSIKVVGKGNKERVVYFSTRARIFLEKYLKERRGDSDIVFLSLKKPYKPLSDRGVRFMLNRLKERAEVSERIFPHNFRRTKATALLNSGMSLQAVQQFLGHSSPVTTEIYATISQENLKNEYKRLTE